MKEVKSKYRQGRLTCSVGDARAKINVSARVFESAMPCRCYLLLRDIQGVCRVSTGGCPTWKWLGKGFDRWLKHLESVGLDTRLIKGPPTNNTKASSDAMLDKHPSR